MHQSGRPWGRFLRLVQGNSMEVAGCTRNRPQNRCRMPENKGTTPSACVKQHYRTLATIFIIRCCRLGGMDAKIDVGRRRSDVASLRNAPGTVPGAFLKFMKDVHNLCRIFQGCISENLIKKAGGEPAFPSPVLWCQNTHIKLLGL
jgi:hypothetical protein